MSSASCEDRDSYNREINRLRGTISDPPSADDQTMVNDCSDRTITRSYIIINLRNYNRQSDESIVTRVSFRKVLILKIILVYRSIS